MNKGRKLEKRRSNSNDWKPLSLYPAATVTAPNKGSDLSVRVIGKGRYRDSLNKGRRATDGP